MKAETVMTRMRIFRSISASVAIVVLLTAWPAHAQYIKALAIDPQTPTTLYAGTYGGGVFKSTDGGASWSASGLINTFISTLTIDPLTPTTLYAGTSGALYKSTDGGGSWSAVDGLPTGASSLAIDPLTPTTLYAGTDAYGVYKSTDRGASWSRAVLFPFYGSFCSPCGGILALAIDPLISTTLYAGTEEITLYDLDGNWLYTDPGRVFKSTDGGASWTSTSLTNASVSALVINPQTPATVYAGTNGGSVFQSADGGVSWNETGITGSNGVLSLAIDLLTPTTLYAGTDSAGVFKSADGGASWSATGLTGFGGLLTLAVDPLTPTTVYAGTGTGGVHKSTNSGVNWNPTGLITWPHISSVSVNPNSVVGGNPSIGTVTLSAAAPEGGAVVTLGIDTGAVWVPASVTVAFGATSADFTISTNPGDHSFTPTISATYGGASSSATFTVLTVTPATAVSSLSLNPTSVTGGASSIGTVTLNTAEPGLGGKIMLFSSNSAVATVPASVTVPAGATSANFSVATVPVSASTSVTISGAYMTISSGYSGWPASADLTVLPAPTTLSSVSLNPTSVTGGTASTGTVNLSGAAPIGGATVALSSSNSAVATVPASATVPAGAANASFTVSTTSCSSRAVTISGTYGGVTKSAGLTVTTTPETLTIQQADYFASRRELRVGAKDTNSSATLRVLVTSTGQLIGQLVKGGDGTYRGQFDWPTNPQNITVQSSLCGSISKAVASK